MGAGQERQREKRESRSLLYWCSVRTPCTHGLLCVHSLSVDLVREGDTIPVLSDISFEMEPRSIVGLFGESGCGKSTLARSLLKLLSPRRYRVRGSVRLNGRELLSLDERQLETVRGAQIGVYAGPHLSAGNLTLAHMRVTGR